MNSKLNPRYWWRKIKYRLTPYNMHASTTEQYYAEQYLDFLAPHLASPCRILDIGCQYGRLTIPLLLAGHQVTGTDLDLKYENYIRGKIKDQANFEYRKQTLFDTMIDDTILDYDIILCTELIYNFQQQPMILKSLRAKLRHGGLLAISHRSKGYFLYKALMERVPSTMKTIISDGRAGNYWCQSANELSQIYQEQGFINIKLWGVGILSGINGHDPWGKWLDPGKTNGWPKSDLKELEYHPMIQRTFMDNARYIFVLAQASEVYT